MTETIQPALEGKAFLLAQGVPADLLQTMHDDGRQPDYLNYYAGVGMYLTALYNPKSPDNHLNDPDARRNIRSRLLKILTYREYWDGRVKRYNRDAAERGHKKVARLPTVDLIMQAHGSAETLNVLAQNLRRAARSPHVQPRQLVEAFAVADASAAGIFRGEWHAKKALVDFGLRRRIGVRRKFG